MIERIKTLLPIEPPAFDFERRFADATTGKSFEDDFFDFDDKLRYWTTIYRYMLFLDFESGTQLMIGIGQKNISNYQLNKIPIEFAFDPPNYKVGLSYWYQNEKTLHETRNDVLESYNDGFVSDTLLFKRKAGGYIFKLKEFDTEVSLTEKRNEDFLKFGNLMNPFQRHNAYFTFKGKVKGTESKGIAFIQKVAINMPFIPWRWGRTFFEDGSQLDFYEPRALVPLFKSLNFKFDDEVYKFNKNVTIAVKGGVENPLWRLCGETDNGVTIDWRIKSYARVCQIFETQRSRFLYNEYPSKITFLKIKKGGEILCTLDDLGRNATNCEESYYSKILANIK
ncbi:MAG: hypothetical protein ACE5J5_00055 [Candidatus Hydrothermarchaeales archaeon]